jgi:hypothetical protein
VAEEVCQERVEEAQIAEKSFLHLQARACQSKQSTA